MRKIFLAILLLLMASPVFAGGINNPSSGGGTASSIAIGTTTIAGGTNGFVLYDNNGVAGNQATVSITGDVTVGTTGASIVGALQGTAFSGVTGIGSSVLNNSPNFIGNVGIGTSASTAALSIASGTQTTNINAVEIFQTWNASGTTFDAPLFENVTNTASGANSLLMDIQLGGVSQFNVKRNGNVTAAGTVLGASTIAFSTTSASGNYEIGTDTFISRNGAAGAVQIGSTSSTGFGSLSLATIKTGGYIVSTLPSGSAGMRAYVTDAVTCTLNGSLTGSGSTPCPVWYNGSAWVGD